VGEAEKKEMAGGITVGGAAVTVTVAVAVAVPNGLRAVRVYKVVAAGFTLTDVPVTTPTPPLMLSVGAPVAAQFNVLDWPTVTLAGVAVKLVMAGGLPTETGTTAVTVPNELVAVSV
jgi:hypothetical protein